MLKNILKQFKLNESTISSFLGIAVIIVVGALVINYFRSLDTGNTLPTGVSDNTTKLPTTHEVVSGDTLWDIAATYYNSGYNWTDIRDANKLTNPNLILVDQKLTIPDVETRLATTTISPTSDSYTVVKGDTLWDIAVSNYGSGYEWINIANANNLANPNMIHAGNVFVLP